MPHWSMCWAICFHTIVDHFFDVYAIACLCLLLLCLQWLYVCCQPRGYRFISEKIKKKKKKESKSLQRRCHELTNCTTQILCCNLCIHHIISAICNFMFGLFFFRLAQLRIHQSCNTHKNLKQECVKRNGSGWFYIIMWNSQAA